MATITVTTASDTVDSGDGVTSLREAVTAANLNADADTIVFDSSLAGSTVTLTLGELVLANDVTIDGDTTGDNKADIAISGNDASRIFNISGATTDVDLLSLTLENGYTADSGGAVYASFIGTLDIADSTIGNSYASGSGGGLMARATDVTLTDSLVTGNRAGGYGGGIYQQFDSLTITNSTIHGNTADSGGGGISVGYNATLNVTSSTVTGNRADADGSGTSFGGGIEDFNSSITITNSVVAENTSGTGLALNDVYGTVDTADHSVFGSAVTITTNTSSQTSVADVGLGALGDHGGTVETRDIEVDSVLINAGGTTSLSTDANGETRVVFGTVDVGATEFAGPLVVTTADDVVDSGDGLLSLREAIALANGDAAADEITFDASLAGQTITLTGGELALTSDMSIDGDVDGDGKADIAISGNNSSRVFNMSGSTTDVDLLSLTLENGNTAASGGAIYASSIGTLDISDTTIGNSYASASGGGLVAKATDVTLTNSLVTGNSTGGYGGGIYQQSNSLTITNSTIHGNTANGYGGGISVGSGTLNLISSTVTGNQADADGSGTVAGGGIEDFGAITNITNSVVAENTSGTGLTLNDVRPGVDTAVHSVFGSAVTIKNSIFCQISVTDINLGELLDNGGTVLTRSPLDGSILIGAGSNAGLPLDTQDIDGDGNTTETLPLDGRGGTRVVDTTVDVGAVEQIVDETINGTSGNNNIIGGLGTDILSGLDGADTVNGGAGSDTMHGGRGHDTLSYAGSTAGVTVNLGSGAASGGDASGDTFASFENLLGSTLGDTLTGNGRDNYVGGSGGADTIKGGNGNDRLNGGNGHDNVNGGGGLDTILLSATASSSDTIGFFVVADDTLEINAASFGGGLTAGVDLTAGQLAINTTGLASDSDDRFILNSSTGQLYFDADGDGAGATTLVATFTFGIPALTVDDFSIV